MEDFLNEQGMLPSGQTSKCSLLFLTDSKSGAVLGLGRGHSVYCSPGRTVV